MFRISSLGFGVYSAGKMVGISEYAKDPRAMEKQLTKQLLMGCAWEKDDKGRAKRPELLRVSDPVHRRIEEIGERIVKVRVLE